ncbi:MAG: hypothetical protein AAF960_07680 [Bacteroidota bacterium]
MVDRFQLKVGAIDTPHLFGDEKVQRTGSICIESWSKCSKGAAHRPHLLKIRFNVNGALHI